MNRLKRAFWVEGVAGAARKAGISITGAVLEHRAFSAPAFSRTYCFLCLRSSVSNGREIYHVVNWRL
ncbi:unnamed protein product, partial [Ascophyllum nodosum]